MSDKAKRFDMNACVGAQLQARGLAHLDAGETAAFARELEYLQAEAIEAKFPEFKGLTLVPVAGGAIPPGVRTHTYREIEGFGEAELLESMTPEDFPTVDVRGAEVSGKFRSIGAKYSVTIEDLRAKPSMSVDVEQKKGNLARKVIESKFDKLVWGSATGLSGPFKGLLHNDLSQDDTAGAAGNVDWSGNDTAKILACMQYVRDTAFAATAGLFENYDFVLSTKCFLKMGLWIPATMAGGGKTLADFILSSVPGIRSISHCSRLDGAGTGGTDRMLAYPRDPEVLDCLVPIRFEQFAPQLAGMAFTTYCSAKYGGIRQRHPKAVRRADIDVTP